MELSIPNVYGHIRADVIGDPAPEAELIDDLSGTLAERFGVAVSQPACRATATAIDGRSAARTTTQAPRAATPGELSEAELELVSDCAERQCNVAGGISNFQRTA